MPNDPKSLQQAVGQARERAQHAVGDTAGAIKSKLGDGADALGSVTSRTPNPIALVIGIAAAGFIAGLLLPLTDIERERLEPLGDELAQRAGDARDEIVQQGRQVVAETVTAARDAVQKHGQELADTLKTSADDLVTGSSTAADPGPKPPAAAVPKAAQTEPKSEGSKTREALEKSGSIAPKGPSSAT